MVDDLRVADWSSFIGQDQLKVRLDVHIQAAKKQKRALDPILLAGRPGFGKTSLATIIAKRLGVELHEYNMPMPEKQMLKLVKSISGVLLLDEVHRAPKSQQEQLLPLLEFGCYQDKNGMKFDSHMLSIVGATTEPENLIKPLYERFMIRPDFDDYTPDEMMKIIQSMAIRKDVKFSDDTALILAKATGGVPRCARQFVLAARDLRQVGRKITGEEVLAFCRVDPSGLSETHRAYLAALERQGGTAGLRTLRTMLRLSEGLVIDTERLLIDQDLITYTEKGRELTRSGYNKVLGK